MGSPSTYVAFTTTYSGGWTLSNTAGVWTSDLRPYFSIPRSGSCSAATTVYVERTATVNGQTFTNAKTRTFS